MHEYAEKWNRFLRLLDGDDLPDEAVELADWLHRNAPGPEIHAGLGWWCELETPTPHQAKVMLTAFLGYFGE